MTPLAWAYAIACATCRAMPSRRGRSADGVGAFAEDRRERLPFHQLHGEKRPVAEPADVVDRHHARVLQLAADLGLFDEPPGDVGPIGVFLQQHLHRQIAAQVDVATAQHRPHAAAGDLAVESWYRSPACSFDGMASDVGLTTSELSPSASLSSTGRIWPTLERGGPGSCRRRRPGPPPASRRRGPEVDRRISCLARAGPAGSGIIIGIGRRRVSLGSPRLVHGFGLRIQGKLLPQDQGRADFRAKKIRKTEKI